MNNVREAELLAIIQEQQVLIEQLTARIEYLEAQLAKNSGKPPSSDGLKKPAPKSLREQGKRNSGGQPGYMGSTSTARQQHIRDFYERIYANQDDPSTEDIDEDSVINQAAQDMVANCPAEIPTNLFDLSAISTYRLCDPTLGAVQRKGGNNVGTTSEYNVEINQCQGLNPQAVLTTNTNLATTFQEQMMRLGVPYYSGTGGYGPDHNTILYPVIFFDRDDDDLVNYQVVGCRWTSIVYQGVENPFNYPR